ncbi:two-component system, response regulator YesN [Gracilibacillus orientalis]|uniref:Two-component system, response regulator YesN n=1 Tax=Gracilibacillus orientalis TaxID=334253 RepID=A0A1I4HNN0_9BACI|nr:response regulator [Gracilibacillus orientalis]SFL43898.1 two-component system, response regulator YesN [Gracilibacillus orientalis]
MIKVLIVEDDKLVRKSFISSFQWEQFDMKIVGDAKNGEKALQFIEDNQVDLIITDLAMPIMSGIELIRIVKEKYPEIFIVVLSLHQDFEYIQEAMRLGAIDYIAKIELDGNNMDDILVRIQNRIEKESEKQSSMPTAEETTWTNGYTLISEEILTVEKALKEFLEVKNICKWNDHAVLIRSDTFTTEGIIRKIVDSKYDIRPLLLVYPETEDDFNEIKEWTPLYHQQLLFYEISQDRQIAIKAFHDLHKPLQETKHQLEKWKKRLILSDWIANKRELTDILGDLYETGFSISQLEELLSWLIHEYKRIYRDILPQEVTYPVRMNYWSDLEQWFKQFQRVMYTTVFSPAYSPETNQCILNAISIIERELSSPLTAQYIAQQVNISRSYFSTCFKDIVGETFNEYIRIARINKAKDYLLYTREKIGVISEKVGYSDVKYFSKIFRQTTGLLPSEYRKLNKKGSNVSIL